MDAKFLIPGLLLLNLLFAGSSVTVGTLSKIGKKIPGVTHHIFYFFLISGTILGNLLYILIGEFAPLAILQLLALISLPFFRKGGAVHMIFGWFSFFLCIFQFFLFKYYANQYLIR